MPTTVSVACLNFHVIINPEFVNFVSHSGSSAHFAFGLTSDDPEISLACDIIRRLLPLLS
jgi:hypothetical protein